MHTQDKYRIIIHITRGSAAGRALTLMASGLICAAKTLTDALTHYERYLDCAEPILATANLGVCYGLIAIIDQDAGTQIQHQVLMGKATVTRQKVGERASLFKG